MGFLLLDAHNPAFGSLAASLANCDSCRRPYHRNCSCSLHHSARNAALSLPSRRPRFSVSFPPRRSYASVALNTIASVDAAKITNDPCQTQPCNELLAAKAPEEWDAELEEFCEREVANQTWLTVHDFQGTSFGCSTHTPCCSSLQR